MSNIIELNCGESKELDQLIKDLWKEKEVHNWYKLEAPHLKQLPGKHGLILACNKARFDSRRKPPPYESIIHPFNPDGFHFNKLKSEETLLRINFPFESPLDHLIFAINVSPIFRYHSLLIPYPLLCKPQMFDATSLRMVLHLSFQLTDPNLIILGNSLLAHATVNHLHFHLLYPDFVPPSAKARGELLAGCCMLLKGYFFPGFLFEVALANTEQVSTDLIRIIGLLIEKNIPHNIIFCIRPDKTRLVLLFPRKATLGKCESETGEKNAPFFVASAELAGMIVLSHGLDTLNEEDCVGIMKESLLDENVFSELVENIQSILV